MKSFEIDPNLSVSEIVANDYRTAEVFRRYGISYCCGGKWPLDTACKMRGVDTEKVHAELETATRIINIPNQVDIENWDIDFLIDYIVNVHHRYLQNSLIPSKELLDDFANEHISKFPQLEDLQSQFVLLIKQLQSAMKREEEVLFPYIRQVAHAHKDKEPYAVLLVRTLRKPVDEAMFKSHETISNILLTIRRITKTYLSPENMCTSHKVVIAKLNELDNDIMQHFYLEQSILFPRAIAIEKEVLAT